MTTSDRYLVISSDCHAGLPPKRYRDYVDPQFRELFDAALPIQEQEVERLTRKFMPDEFKAAWRKDAGEGWKGAWDSAERNRQLDGDGIVGEVIFPDGVNDGNMPPFGAGLTLPPEVPSELIWAGAQAHNRWLAEFCAEAPARRAGMAVVPMAHDPVRAVEEIRWAREHGLRGVFIAPMWGKHEPYHSPVYEPVWSLCEELGMPVNIHGGAAPNEDYGDYPGCIGIFITEVAWWSVRPVWFLIWSGVFERHPKLKFVITELGASWVPELKALMDQRYEANHFTAKLAPYRNEMTMKPSEYFERNCFVGASVTSRSDVELRHAIGVDNMMWGSDYPHPEGAWPYTAKFMAESFHDIPDEDVRKMLGGTAAQVYGFDVAALTPLVRRIGPRPEDLSLAVPVRAASAG